MPKLSDIGYGALGPVPLTLLTNLLARHGKMHRAHDRGLSRLSWAIGDLLLCARTYHGRSYEWAMEITGLSYDRLAQLKRVAKRFKFCRRRQNLHFEHHVAVAVLSDAQQEELLDWAQRKNQSREDLREAVRELRAGAILNDLISDEPETSAPSTPGGEEAIPYTATWRLEDLLGMPAREHSPSLFHQLAEALRAESATWERYGRLFTSAERDYKARLIGSLQDRLRRLREANRATPEHQVDKPRLH